MANSLNSTIGLPVAQSSPKRQVSVTLNSTDLESSEEISWLQSSRFTLQSTDFDEASMLTVNSDHDDHDEYGVPMHESSRNPILLAAKDGLSDTELSDDYGEPVHQSTKIEEKSIWTVDDSSILETEDIGTFGEPQIESTRQSIWSIWDTNLEFGMLTRLSDARLPDTPLPDDLSIWTVDSVDSIWSVHSDDE